jgi:hypothetical protein
MSRNAASKLKNISRMDCSSTHGWFVRIYHHGRVYRKLFSDIVFGSGEAALQAAIAHRDEFVREHQIEYLPFFTKPMKSNKTGVHGVSETFYSTRSGKRVPYFSVFWAPSRNERRTKRFYMHNYASREEALRVAAEFRKEKEEEILALYQAGEYK